MRKKASVEQKMAKILSQPAVDEITSADSNKLMTIISTAALNVEAIEEQRDGDARIQAVKSDLKDLSGSYSDAIKVEKTKVKFCRLRLREMGKLA